MAPNDRPEFQGEGLDRFSQVNTGDEVDVVAGTYRFAPGADTFWGGSGRQGPDQTSAEGNEVAEA